MAVNRPSKRLADFGLNTERIQMLDKGPSVFER
jgi:hypothetical protein